MPKTSRIRSKTDSNPLPKNSAPAKSYAAKLRPDLTPKRTRDARDGATMLIPTPRLIADEVKKTRRGQVITVTEIRSRLARRFRVKKTCPLVTGIFLNILSGAAEEAEAAGKKPPAPWWRVVDDEGRLLEKWPPGVVRQAERLAAEGVVAVASGRSKRLAVMGFEARR